jgi:hypothetical protein
MIKAFTSPITGIHQINYLTIYAASIVSIQQEQTLIAMNFTFQTHDCFAA